MNIENRSPVNGYNFEAKELYRRSLYYHVPGLLTTSPHRDAVILAGKEGLEIPYAQEAGFSRKHIVCVDDNAAIVAHWPWRTKHPCYGNTLSRAVERMAEDGREVSFLNADLCGNFSRKTRKEIIRIGERIPLTLPCAVAFTLMKGREDPEDVNLLEMWAEAAGCVLHDGPAKRIQAAAHLFGKAAGICFQGILTYGEYRSGTKNMVWGLYASGLPKAECSIMSNRTGAIYGYHQLIHDMQQLGHKLGRTPRLQDIVENDSGDRDRLNAYAKIFDTLTVAQAVAGLPPNRPHTQQILEQAELVHKKYTGTALNWTKLLANKQLSNILPQPGGNYTTDELKSLLSDWKQLMQQRALKHSVV